MSTTTFRTDSAGPARINVAALVLRLGLAVIFLFHGLDKIINGDGGTSWASNLYASQTLKPETRPEAERNQLPQLPASLAYPGVQLAVAWGEFLGGLALLAGLLTRLASLGLIVIQIGAVCVVTAPRGFSFHKGGGYEYNLALLVMCLALLVLGAGIWSVDWMLARNRMKAHAARHPTTTTPALAGPHLTPEAPREQVASGPAQTS